MSSQSGSFDAAQVIASVAPTYSFSINSSTGAYSRTPLGPTQVAVTYGANSMSVSGGTTLTINGPANTFNQTAFTAGTFAAITPETGVSTPSNTTFADGSPVTPITLIALPIVSNTNSQILTLTLPRTFPNGRITSTGSLGIVSLGTNSTPTTNFTNSGGFTFPVIPAGTLVNVTTSGTPTNANALNYNRLVNVSVVTSTTSSLILSGNVYDVGTLTFAASGLTGFSFASSALGTYSATVSYAGTGYVTGDTFLVRGTLFGGTSPTNDALLTVTSGTSSLGIPNAVSSVSVSGTPASGTPVTVGPITLEFSNTKTLRDGSDNTRNNKETLIYNEYRRGTNIAGSSKATRLGGTKLNDSGGANQLELRQSNGFRLSYLKGRMNCGACYGGFLNANGPQSGS